MAKLSNRIKNAFTAFMTRDPTNSYQQQMSTYYGERPDRPRLKMGNSKSIITAIYNRIAVDCSLVDIKHITTDENGRYVKTINSGLNKCLGLSANIDQTGRQLIHDIVLSLLDEGNVAVCPIDTDIDDSGLTTIESLRVCEILEWGPTDVRVRGYNDRVGVFDEIWFPKKDVAIIENPFYSVMNEAGSTARRLVNKLNLLDNIDAKSGSTKLDLIIGLPYVVKTDIKRQQAEKRRDTIIKQLQESEYGIAYTDGTEKITQLNRAVESNLMPQIEYYTKLLYSQLGITEAIMNNTASPEEKQNYNNGTIEPILNMIVEEIKRKFLTDKQIEEYKESIQYFRDPFKLIPISELPDMADKLGRNEIVTSNEFRQGMGMLPSKDPKADELRNKNLSVPKTEETIDVNETITKKEEKNQNDET